MNVAEFTLKTLRQARGSMRPPDARSNLQLSVLRTLPAGVWMSLGQLARTLDVSTNSLAGSITLLVDKRLLDRIGDRGDYRYTASAAGRALCE